VAKYVLFYDFLATTPLLWLVGTTIASCYGRGEKRWGKNNFANAADVGSCGWIYTKLFIHFFADFFLKTLDLMGYANSSINVI
jgi:hypothetical protein